jgi:hypothetical protein
MNLYPTIQRVCPDDLLNRGIYYRVGAPSNNSVRCHTAMPCLLGVIRGSATNPHVSVKQRTEPVSDISSPTNEGEGASSGNIHGLEEDNATNSSGAPMMMSARSNEADKLGIVEHHVRCFQIAWFWRRTSLRLDAEHPKHSCVFDKLAMALEWVQRISMHPAVLITTPRSWDSLVRLGSRM